MVTEKAKIIPYEYIPDVGSKVVRIDDKNYLVANDAMYTFYERSKGEFSDYFLALRDEKRILGCKCTQCGIVRVPPFLTTCPDCDFAPTETIEAEQVGRMLCTPPITYFANSLFLHMAPYGRGRVILNGADTALSVNLYTTTGILVPGLIKKGTEVKVIFKDNRIGEAIDIFCVPASELTSEQIAQKGLQESELDWQAAKEPEYPDPSREEQDICSETLEKLQSLARQMNDSKRCRKATEGWKRNIAVKSKGGEFAMIIDNGDFKIEDRKIKSPDFVMACEDLRTLYDGLANNGAITDSVVMKKLWISKNFEFNTIFKLDRMARFLVQEAKKGN